MAKNDQRKVLPRAVAELAFSNLVVAVMIDGRVEPSEKAWVHYARRLLGLDVQVANAIIKEMSSKPLHVQVPAGPKEKGLCFDLMVAACKADGKIQDQEMALLKSLGPRFGHTEAEIEQKLQTITMKSIEKELGCAPAAEPRVRERVAPRLAALEAASEAAHGDQHVLAEGAHVVRPELQGARLRLETILGHLAEAGVDRLALAALEEMKAQIEETEKALDAAIKDPKLTTLVAELTKTLREMAASLKSEIDSPVGARLLRQHHHDVLDILDTLSATGRKPAGK